MKVNTSHQKAVYAKTLKVLAKVGDCFSADLLGRDGEKICHHAGYVPDFFPDQHYGDYLILHIDIDTGRITNWQAPDADALERFINSSNNEEQYE